MNPTQPYLFRGEIPTPKRQPKRSGQPGRRRPRLPLPKLSAWAPWVLLGVVLYGLLFWGIERLGLATVSSHLVAWVGVITLAACVELTGWIWNGKQPPDLMLPMGLGGVIAMLLALL
ncbi:hypothetical protein [Halomonas sp. 3H]|uniref:hypothetical protein n=1 Tax=Halomonas sp. 3H TaxID=2952527 RepID=UPI0020B7A40C|nr:hypothetical protein [Halomonas sp. 3H]